MLQVWLNNSRMRAQAKASCSYAIAAGARQLRSLPPTPINLLLRPPASAGSLGDQAAAQGVLDGFVELSHEEIFVHQVVEPKWQPQDLTSPTAPVVFEGTSPRFLLRFIRNVRVSRYCGVIGADMMDGGYSMGSVRRIVEFSNFTVRAGVPTTIFGFSFAAEPNVDAVNALRALDRRVELLVRDPVSKERFEGHTKRSTRLVADLAFLMKPRLTTANAKAAADWVENRRRAGRRIVAVNANPLTTGSSDHSHAVIGHCQCLTALAQRRPDVDFIFVPHDFREHLSDTSLLREIYNGLARDGSTSVHLLEPPFSAWDVKSVVGGVDLVFTARMHLAIAALGQGVPVACTVYQGKFEGLLSHFGLDCPIVQPGWWRTCPEAIAGILANAIDCAPRDRATIQAALPTVQRLALDNLRGLAASAGRDDRP